MKVILNNWMLRFNQEIGSDRGIKCYIENTTGNVCDFPLLGYDDLIKYDFPERVPKYVKDFLNNNKHLVDSSF